MFSGAMPPKTPGFASKHGTEIEGGLPGRDRARSAQRAPDLLQISPQVYQPVPQPDQAGRWPAVRFCYPHGQPFSFGIAQALRISSPRGLFICPGGAAQDGVERAGRLVRLQTADTGGPDERVVNGAGWQFQAIAFCESDARAVADPEPDRPHSTTMTLS